jgi:hypothetical protein
LVRINVVEFFFDFNVVEKIKNSRNRKKEENASDTGVFGEVAKAILRAPLQIAPLWEDNFFKVS